MKINIAGDISTARKNRIERVNELAAGLVAVHIPKGLEPIFAERRVQGKDGTGRMVNDHAKRRGITTKEARVEMTDEADAISFVLGEIEKQRQSAIVSINLALTVADMDTVTEGAF